MNHPRESPKSDRWILIESLFEQAVDLPAGKRRELLDQTCAGDADLRSAVERMIAADSRADGLLDMPLSSLGGGLFGDPPLPFGDGPDDPRETEAEEALPEGTRVGPYRIVQAIARGGMGAVYRAARADGSYEQEVALKVVRGSWIAGELERRFLQERQILARLDHPGIARLLDGGLTEEGSPYLAMELVAGAPITRWIVERGLDVATRLRVFLEVCDAVQYAHQNLVLHRDIKPSNILVTAEGRARLLDFGIARLLVSPEAPESETLTRGGALLLTPEYAAPEQLRGEPTSTATDVYALGAVLYEILAGRRAFVLRSHSWSEMVRVLSDDPPPLSRAPDLDRKTRRRLEGDLETIVRKAMHKESARRYRSAEALADDVRRHLAGLPVSAQPDTLGYRLGKYLRRNRVGVLATAAVAVALFLGAGATLLQARATRVEAARAEAVRDFLFSLFEGADPYQNLGRIPDARELLDRGAARVDSLGPEVGAEIRVDLLTTLGLLYQNLGLFEESGALLGRAVSEADMALGEDARTALAWDALAANWIEAGELDSAQVAATKALATREHIHAPDSLVAASYSTLGTIAHSDGRLEEGAAYHRRALDLDRRAHPGDGARIVTDLNNLGLVLRDIGDVEESERVLTEALDMSRRVYGDDHPEVAVALGSLATAVGAGGDLASAADLHRQALEINRAVFGHLHPEVARSLDQWALWLDRQGDHVASDSIGREALAIREAILGPDHSDVGVTLTNLATARYRRGDYSGAAAMQERALAIWLRTYGEDHPRTAIAINNLGAMQLRAGDLAAAERNLTRSLDLRRRLFPEGHEDVGAALRNLGDLRRAQGRPDQAVTLYAEARSSLEAALGPDHWRIADADLGLGAALVELGRPADAIAPLRDALRIRSSSFVEDDLRIDEVRLWHGLALAALGQFTEARPLLVQARAAFVSARGEGDADASRAGVALAAMDPPGG